jgi:hypothetical protein
MGPARLDDMEVSFLSNFNRDDDVFYSSSSSSRLRSSTPKKVTREAAYNDGGQTSWCPIYKMQQMC